MPLQRVPDSNRPALFQAINATLAEAKQRNCYVGLVLVDIKNFTSVNRVFNYSHGDVILFLLNERLKQIAGRDDCVFRYGSDEFALILPYLESGSNIVLQASRILDQVREPYLWHEREFSFDVNLGCIALPAVGTTADELLGSAEHLLQKAKKDKRSMAFDTQVQRQDDDYVWILEQDLLRALHNNELALQFQPKIDLASGRPIHAEALLRWHHPSKGTIATSFIIEMIARLNREFELTKWVLNAALRQMMGWSGKWGENGVAINIPANLVHHPEFRQLVDDAVHLWKVKPQQLTLEITETAIIEDEQAGFNNLAYFKDRGIGVSIDDFGTGYSSLEYFKSIPATELKIDQSFVINMAHSSDDYNIARLIIDLAHRFNLKVVAEGVESGSALHKLKQLGCDYAQGFFISKPISSESYDHWLQTYEPLPIGAQSSAENDTETFIVSALDSNKNS